MTSVKLEKRWLTILALAVYATAATKMCIALNNTVWSSNLNHFVSWFFVGSKSTKAQCIRTQAPTADVFMCGILVKQLLYKNHINVHKYDKNHININVLHN